MLQDCNYDILLTVPYPNVDNYFKSNNHNLNHVMDPRATGGNNMREQGAHRFATKIPYLMKHSFYIVS